MQCRQCGQDKLSDGFYASSPRKCKECVKGNVRANRAANEDHYRAFDRARANLPHRVEARRQYQTTDAYRESHSKAAKKWIWQHPDKRVANLQLYSALKSGRLQRYPCAYCGAEKVEGHHPDYSRPLDVIWLCSSHHSQLHTEFDASQRESFVSSATNSPHFKAQDAG